MKCPNCDVEYPTHEEAELTRLQAASFSPEEAKLVVGLLEYAVNEARRREKEYTCLIDTDRHEGVLAKLKLHY